MNFQQKTPFEVVFGAVQSLLQSSEAMIGFALYVDADYAKRSDDLASGLVKPDPQERQAYARAAIIAAHEAAKRLALRSAKGEGDLNPVFYKQALDSIAAHEYEADDISIVESALRAAVTECFEADLIKKECGIISDSAYIFKHDDFLRIRAAARAFRTHIAEAEIRAEKDTR